MSHPTKTILCTLMLLLTVTCLVGIHGSFYKASAQEASGLQEDADYPLPKGKWSITVIPDLKQRDDASAPVVVDSTTISTNKGKDSAFENVILSNRSDKTVSAVKLRYVIYKMEPPETILYQSASFEIKAKKGTDKNPFKANKRWVFDIPDGRLAKLIKPIVKDGVLDGGFAIRVSVDEVIFEDGTAWKDQGVLG